MKAWQGSLILAHKSGLDSFLVATTLLDTIMQRTHAHIQLKSQKPP